MIRTRVFPLAMALFAHTPAALASEPPSPPPVVVSYDAPPECPNSETFAATIRAELAARRVPHFHVVEVQVVLARGEHGYAARVTATSDSHAPLERTVEAPTCQETADIAAAVIALAQSDWPRTDVAVTPVSPPTPPVAPPLPPLPAEPQRSNLAYSFSLGYVALTEGPEVRVAVKSGLGMTFNPAQGVRLGFGVTGNFGWWKPSLHLSASYMRQSTRGHIVYFPKGTPDNNVDINDRDVLLETVDACPLQVDYAFLSLIPCGTFSMMQGQMATPEGMTQGEMPGLETGFGGSARLRASFLSSFFAEAMGTGIATSSSYVPPSRSARFFYGFSLGMTMR